MVDDNMQAYACMSSGREYFRETAAIPQSVNDVARGRELRTPDLRPHSNKARQSADGKSP